MQGALYCASLANSSMDNIWIEPETAHMSIFHLTLMVIPSLKICHNFRFCLRPYWYRFVELENRWILGAKDNLVEYTSSQGHSGLKWLYKSLAGNFLYVLTHTTNNKLLALATLLVFRLVARNCILAGMTKPANIDAIEDTTGISWKEWVYFLEGENASSLSHKEIAQKVYEKLGNRLDNSGWWSQSVAVAYEQHIGRRKPGQRSDGSYEVTANKTLSGSPDDALAAWTTLVGARTEFDGVSFDEPSVSKTDKWRHWRAAMGDGSRVSVSTTAQSSEKSIISVTSSKLESSEHVERWRAYWKTLLQDL